MFAAVVKSISIAALLLAAIFWPSAPNYELLLDFVVCIGAIVVFQQALRAKEGLWAVGFGAIAVLFNPAMPVFRPSGNLFLVMAWVCAATFATSLEMLKTQPLLSIPSITGRNPGSESL